MFGANSVISSTALFLMLFSQQAMALTIVGYYPAPGFFPPLYIRGDGCNLNWNSGLQMTRETGTDKFVVELDCLATQQAFEVKLLADDSTWMQGSNAHIDPAKGNSFDIYPWFNTKSGSTTVIPKVYSKELNNTRDVIVYLPPSYNENTLKRYKNVLIAHDGQNLFNPATSYMGNCWNMDDSMDGSIIGGYTDEVLIVGPYNTDDRMNEYTYVYDPSEGVGGKGDLYLDWIESTLIPLVREEFRVDISRDTLGILGSSLGGLISCYAGWTRPDVYGKVGCMSSSFWWDDNDFQNNVIPKTTPSAPLNTFYMDSGTGSIGEKQCTMYTTNIHDQMLVKGFGNDVDVFQYVDEGATHSETYWGPRFHISMEDLYPSSTV